MSKYDCNEPTLFVERNGTWMVVRPHATGYDFGPGRYLGRGEKSVPHADVQGQVDYYRNIMRIVDRRVAS